VWLIYSLLTAFTQAGSDACVKGMGGRYHPWQLLWARSLFWGVLAVALVPWIPATPVHLRFWAIMAIDLPLELAAIYLYWNAIERSPISLSLPFLSFTPIFLLVTSPILTGEHLSLWGVGGVVLVAVGSYILLTEEGSALSFMKTLQREQGCQMMLGVAAIYSITANLGKLAIEASSPLFVAVVFSAEMVAVSTLIMLATKMDRPRLKDPLLVGMGAPSALSILFHLVAISMVQVPYMIALKRTSALWGALLGMVIFKESRPLGRLAGGSLMVAGAIVISLWG
jgi:drug/metabolite transporter (DMT)-like permease